MTQRKVSASRLSRYTMNWTICLAVVMFFLGVYLFTGGDGFYSTDGETMLRTTWAIVDKGQLSVPCDPGQPSAIKGREGRCYSRYGLGQPLAAIPLYLIGKGVTIAFPALDYGDTMRFTMARFNQFIMALVCGMIYALGTLMYKSHKTGIGLALLFGLSTLALPYSRFYFNEPLTTLGFLIALYGMFAYSGEGTRKQLVIGGAGFGLAILTRATSALLLPLFLAYVWSVRTPGDSHFELVEEPPVASEDEASQQAQGDTRKSSPFLTRTRPDLTNHIKQTALFLLPVIALSLIQAGYQFWAFSNPLSGGYQGESWQTPLLIGVYGLLLSPGKSLFLFVPLTLLAPWGWARWIIEGHKREARLSIASFVLWLLFHASWWTWHGGWSWGPRFLVPVLPFLILPVGSLWNMGKGARIAIVVLALAGFVVQLSGILVDFNDYMMWINDEDKILFNPDFLPIIGHWRMLFNGERPDLVFLNMPGWAAVIWGTVCGLLVLAGGQLMRTTQRRMTT